MRQLPFCRLPADSDNFQKNKQFRKYQHFSIRDVADPVLCFLHYRIGCRKKDETIVPFHFGICLGKRRNVGFTSGGSGSIFIVGVSQETQQVGSVAGRYGWHTQPLWLMAALFFVELAAFFWMYRKITVEEKCGEWLLYVLYAVLTILVFYSMDTPNIFGRGEWGDSYHAHAYFNSIYNVHWGMPYTAELTSIYGHYALLWKLPMKLIGEIFGCLCF